MSLMLSKIYNYANSYHTNWFYLNNMTSLQMKALNGINWIKSYKEIHTGLGYVPEIWIYKKYAENSVKGFTGDLNKKIMEL